MAFRTVVIFLISLVSRCVIAAPPPTATTEGPLVTLPPATRDTFVTLTPADTRNASSSNVTRAELSYRFSPPTPSGLAPSSSTRTYTHTRHNNKPHTTSRKRHRNRKVQQVARWSGDTRRGYTSVVPPPSVRQESPVAIILAKLNSDRGGSPSMRPYRLEKGSRDLKPMEDDSNETLQEILNAIKLQVTEQDITDTLIGDAFNNVTLPNDDIGLERKVPSKRLHANDSAKANKSFLKALELMSLENLAESYTEPSFDYVVQSRADTFQQTETPSTLPSEYLDDLNNYETLTTYNIDNDELTPFNDEAKTSFENVMEFQPIDVEPADTDDGIDENQLFADMLESAPRLCSQTDYGTNETCLVVDDAPNNLTETPCDVTLEPCPSDHTHTCTRAHCDDTHTHTCQGALCDGTHTCTRAHCDDTLTHTDEDDVTGCLTGGCLAARRDTGGETVGGDTGEDLGEDEVNDGKKKDVVMAVNRKSYKISIIFQ